MKRILVAIVVLYLCSVASMAQKPFLGVWQKETPDDYHLLCLDLYQKSMTTPDQEAKAYGYLKAENEFSGDYWVISKLISISENEARVKCFSWRYGEPDDEEDAVIKYNPADKTLTFQRGDVPVIFGEVPQIPSNVKSKIFHTPDIRKGEELKELSFFPKNGKWMLLMKVYDYQDESHINHKWNNAYIGTLQKNKFVFTKFLSFRNATIDELSDSEFVTIEPTTFYYIPGEKAFWSEGTMYVEE